jgi:hypothetical protein
MMRKLIVSAVLVLAAIVPLSADVKYTMHMEARMAAGGSNDMIAQMAGPMMMKMFPAGGLDQVIIAGERGMWCEQKQAFQTTKAGTITLMKPDGSMFMIDPSTKTYWKAPSLAAEAAGMMGGMKPEIKVVKRGEFETINGLKAEHIVLALTMPIPGVDPSQLPPGMPGELTLSYEAWMTDAYKAPAGAMTLASAMLKQLGLGEIKELSDGRMMVKGVISIFGVEIVTTATGFSNEPAAPELFEIPKDYKEVPAPIK